MHWDFALIVLFFAIAVPLLGRRRIQQLLAAPETTKQDRLRLYASTIAFQWIAVAVILWRASAHGISITDLGLAMGNPSLTAAVAISLTALVLGNQVVALKRLSIDPQAVMGQLQQVALRIFPQDNAERAAFFFLVTTVAICEEVIFRGFFQRLFESLAGNVTLVGILGSAALFAVSHLYQGRKGVIVTFVVGLIFSAIRAWTGSLLPSGTAHFFADLVVGLMAPGRILAAMQQDAKLIE
jgi:membrane protease YdiL (CAAX protease family)